jgi:dienelactone hydrolase
MAIHGHGAAEPCVGLADDYHHMFALRSAQAGHLVLCPELRGFSALRDMAATDSDHWLDYWTSERGRQFTLVSDAFLYGRTIIGQTIEDILRWEDWLARARGVAAFDAVGISYGGDLAIMYPPFSRRVRSIYTSGSMGSFAPIFARCYNAPAHCIPSVLQWMDRSDIAGLSAPAPIRLHYGERDTPGPTNGSASYNETVQPAFEELRAIYRAFGAEDRVSMRVTPGGRHEMENDDWLAFLARQT